MVRFAVNDWQMARVGGRAALLCACTIAALIARPVFAVPIQGNPADLESLGASHGREFALRRGDADMGLRIGQLPGSGQVTANSGTFDVSVSAPAEEPSGAPATVGNRPKTEIAATTMGLQPMRQGASAAQLERLLVTTDAAPPADTAIVDGGAVVLARAGISPGSAPAATALGTAQPLATSGGTLEYKGVTLGCFGDGCTPASSSTLGGLSFTGGTFDQFASDKGFAGIGGSAQSNLGVFSLNSTSFDYTGVAFSLLVNFTSPTAASSTFSVLLLGGVSGENTGGIQISFSNPTQSITYSGGTFSLHINDLAMSDSVTGATLSGFISGPPPPPPPPPAPEVQVPRDEIVTTLSSDSSTKKTGGDDTIVLDFSQLASADDGTAEIDTGVTSGADPSEWDPIDISAEGRVEGCVSEDPTTAKDKSAPAVCQSAAPQK